MYFPSTHLTKLNSFLLILLASICANGCSEESKDNDNPTQQNENACTSNADCAARTDGKTQCDLINSLCVVPLAPGQECTSDADCSARTDGKTQCDTALHQCVAPAPAANECTGNADCSTRTDGKTQCDTASHQCVVPNNPQATCGDDHQDMGEDCDGQDLDGKSCADWDEFIAGALSCNGSCHFDTSGCAQCTDENLSLCQSGQTCSNGHCVEAGHTVTCGDELVEGDEQCDGKNLNGKSCADFEGFAAGDLKCNVCKFDMGDCLECSKNADCENRTDGKTVCTANTCTKPAPDEPAKVVISQIYPAGGNQGAIYNTKYIELLNIGTSEADISGWSLQYGIYNKDTISGNPCTLPSNVKLPRGGYYLVALNSGSNGEAIPTADHTCSMTPAAAKGKLFLVDNGTALTSSTPTSGYVDAIGYGTANWSEGNNPVASLSATTAALRKNNGCTDTDNNGNDFEVSAPAPRNSHSPINLCDGSVPPETPTCNNGKIESGEDCDGTQFVDNKNTCSAWDDKYTSGSVSCNNCKVDLSKCSTTSTPVCGNGKIESGEDCDELQFVDNKTECSAWDSKYKSGSVSCNKCKVDYSKCSTLECTEDSAECVEKEFSIKKCIDGKYVTEKCPDEKPYCKTDAEACTRFYPNDACQSNTFIPHVATSFDASFLLFLCPIYYTDIYGEEGFHQGDISASSYKDYMRAKRGYGVAPSFTESCNTKGEVRTYAYSEGNHKRYYSCQKCKVNQDGELYWFYVPATYTTTGYNISCEPWDDVE